MTICMKCGQRLDHALDVCDCDIDEDIDEDFYPSSPHRYTLNEWCDATGCDTWEEYDDYYDWRD